MDETMRPIEKKVKYQEKEPSIQNQLQLLHYVKKCRQNLKHQQNA